MSFLFPDTFELNYLKKSTRHKMSKTEKEPSFMNDPHQENPSRAHVFLLRDLRNRYFKVKWDIEFKVEFD